MTFHTLSFDGRAARHAGMYIPENETAPAPRRLRDRLARPGATLRALARLPVDAVVLAAVVALCVASIVSHLARAATRRRAATSVAATLPRTTHLNAGA